MRNDVGILKDRQFLNVSAGLDLGGFEFGTGQAVHSGANFEVNAVTAKSGKWSNDNFMSSRLRFQDKDVLDPFFESVYFKQAGEKTARVNEAYLTSLGGFDPIRIGIDKSSTNAPAKARFERLRRDHIASNASPFEMYEHLPERLP